MSDSTRTAARCGLRYGGACLVVATSVLGGCQTTGTGPAGTGTGTGTTGSAAACAEPSRLLSAFAVARGDLLTISAKDMLGTCNDTGQSLTRRHAPSRSSSCTARPRQRSPWSTPPPPTSRSPWMSSYRRRRRQDQPVCGSVRQPRSRCRSCRRGLRADSSRAAGRWSSSAGHRWCARARLRRRCHGTDTASLLSDEGQQQPAAVTRAAPPRRGPAGGQSAPGPMVRCPDRAGMACSQSRRSMFRLQRAGSAADRPGSRLGGNSFRSCSAT